MDGLNSDGYLHNVVLHRNSISNRKRLKSTLILHVLLLLLVVFRLASSLLVLVNIRPPAFLQLLRFPRPWLWEHFWLLSAVAVAFGAAGVRRNRILYLQQFIVSSLVFGVLPTLYGIFDLSDELVDYFRSHRTTKTLFGGLPVVVVWNMFLAVSLQVQGFALYFAWQLVKTWKARIELRKLKQ